MSRDRHRHPEAGREPQDRDAVNPDSERAVTSEGLVRGLGRWDTAFLTIGSVVCTRWSIHATSTGKAFLAAFSEGQRKSMLVLPLSRRTSSTIVDIEKLERELEQVRERGYATAHEELEAGVSAVGTALRSSLGTPVGSLSLGGPTSRFTPEHVSSLAQELVSIAERLAPSLHAMQ
jgi:DNA-binding IclR family transcriptional regulator